MNQLRNDLELSQSKAVSVEKKSNDITEQYQKAQKLIEKLQHDLKVVQERFEISEKQSKETVINQSKQKQDIDKLNNDLHAMTIKKETAEKLAEKYSTNLSILQIESNQSIRRASELDSLAASLSGRESELARKEEVVKRMNEGLEKKINILKSSKEALQIKSDTSDARIVVLEKDIENMKKEKMKLEKELSQWIKKVNNNNHHHNNGKVENNNDNDNDNKSHVASNGNKLNNNNNNLDLLSSSSATKNNNSTSQVKEKQNEKKSKSNSSLPKDLPAELERLKNLLDNEKSQKLYSWIACIFFFIVSVGLGIALSSDTRNH